MADIDFRVRVALDGSGTLTDISDRVRRIRGRYGRHRGLYQYETGRVRVSLHSDDNFLTPGGGSTFQTDLAHGGECRITASVGSVEVPIFSGRVDSFEWEGGTTQASATLVITDGFARLSHADLIADLPAERTGERVNRILDLAKYPSSPGARSIDPGTITCEAVSVEGTALDLLRICTATEGGRLDIPHSGAIAGAVEFAQRAPLPEIAATITDSRQVGSLELTPSGNPITEQDPDLLINRVEFSLPNGGEVVAENLASEERYGLQVLRQKVFGNRADSQALADWWIDLFSLSYFRTRAVGVSPHFESDAAALIALGITVGSVVSLSYTPAGGASRVATTSIVDGVQFSVLPLSPESSASQVEFRWALFPSESSAYWILADPTSGLLGSTARLGPPIGAEDIARPRNQPAGRIRWEDGAYVTAAEFSGGITSQALTRYDSDNERALAESRPQIGQATVLGAATLTSGTPDLSLEVWTGRRFTPQLSLGAEITEEQTGSQTGGGGDPEPEVGVVSLSISASGPQNPLLLSWSYIDPDGVAPRHISIRRKTYHVEASDHSTATAQNLADDPLGAVTRIRYRGGTRWRQSGRAILTYEATTYDLAGWLSGNSNSPHRFAIRLKNEAGSWSPWTEDIIIDPEGPGDHSPELAFSAPETWDSGLPLPLSWSYSDADNHYLTHFYLWTIRNGASFVWDGSDFSTNQAGVAVIPPAFPSALVPVGWGAPDGNPRTYYLVGVSEDGARSIPARADVLPV